MGNVPALSIAFMVLSAAIACLLPMALWLLLWRRDKSALLMPLFVGAGTFVVAALILESGVYWLLLQNAAISGLMQSSPWFYALFGGLMAGLFEETGRLLAFQFLLRRNRTVSTALSYGIGHGGIEAAFLVGLSMISNIATSLMLNTGGAEAVLAQIPPEQTEVVLASLRTLTENPPHMFLIGGLERIPAIAFHIAASVLVWLAASGRGSFGFYPLAILLHMTLNLPAGLYQTGVLNVYVTELMILILAAAICLITHRIYRKCSQSYDAMLDSASAAD